MPFSEGEAVKAHYEASGAPFVWKPLEGWGHSAWQAEVSGKSLAEVSHHFATTALDLTVDKD